MDEAFMRAALAYAALGLGKTAPMPSVAALVVDESRDPPRMLGRGRTAPGGRPHAEAFALDAAGVAARGATLYVTLEPCANRSQRYFGPSCTERILESGIARVVIASADPSPFAAGEGARRLRAAGVIVEEGVLSREAARLNQGHCQRVRLNRPFIRVKLAATADGYAGTPERGPLRITGDDARARVHRLRADVDALVTGIGTVIADDPMLDVRLPGMADFSPLRVILDTEGRLPPTARLVADARRVPVLVATAEPEALRARLGEVEGLEVIAIPRAGEAGENVGLDLAAVFGALAARGITRVMVEAGPKLADAVAAAGLCDELALFESKTAAGSGIVAIGPALADWVAKADLHSDTKIGPDRLRVLLRA
jgi:diaminohydroxyphosphoribosylaminopyrimidine deaminase/5-amino-6-(5-phosphoribosylamino)uracil reductase